MRRLIVNADDFNLTGGVARAIFLAHDRGIVTSTSVFTNLAFSSFQLEGLLKRKLLGISLHLNVTFGKPVSDCRKIRSLLNSDQAFKRLDHNSIRRLSKEELTIEFGAQLACFRSIFKKMPDHLNTHHHIHVFPNIFDVVCKIAEKNHIPIRRVSLVQSSEFARKVVTTDYLFGNLSKDHCWTRESLTTILRHLPEGTSEIMCHPGLVDRELREKSSFVSGRNSEFQLFSKPSLRPLLRAQNISLVSKI